MRILQLCNRVPYPPRDGGAIAMLQMTEELHRQGHELHLLCLNTRKHFVHESDLPPLFSELASFQAVKIDTDLKPMAAISNLFKKESYHISRFYSEVFEQELEKLLEKNTFDIIHVEGLHMSLYLDAIRNHTKAKIVLRAHNIEHLIWQRLHESELNPAKRWYIRLLTKKLKRFEISILNRFDAVVPITQKDAQDFKKLGCRRPMHVSPTGLDLVNYKPDAKTIEPATVFHLGAMNWMPNQQAVSWFVKDVWPSVQKEVPEARFYICGKDMPGWIKNLEGPGVVIVGEVEDARALMNSKAIMVAPLLSGSGMRIKIVEGMAMGKAIVSTTIGAEGIGCTNGLNILIADEPRIFARHVVTLLRAQDEIIRLGTAARQFAESRYDNEKIIGELAGFYQSLATLSV